MPPAPRSCVGAPECFLPEELYAGTTPCGAVRLALAGSYLYWTNEAVGSVSKIATVTHLMVGLNYGLDAPTFLVANDGSQPTVYWAMGGNQIRETYQPNASSLTTTTYGAVGGMTIRSADTPAIFYSAGMGIYLAPLSVPLATEETGVPAALDHDSGFIALLTKDGNVDVVRESSNDGAATVCAADPTSATNHGCIRVASNQTGLLLDDVHLSVGQVYWARGASIYKAAASAFDGAPAPFVTTAHGGDVTSFFVLGSSIYLAEDGTIERAPTAGGGKAVPIAAGQAHPKSVRADGNNVYWSRSDCAIMNVRHD
jgi:hypothetical protein